MAVEYHGKLSRFWLGTFALPATLVDVSGYFTNIAFPQEFDEDETSAFGDGTKEFILGLSDSTLTLTGNYDPTIAAQLGALHFSDVTPNWEYYPIGPGTGKVKYAGTGAVYTFNRSRNIQGKQTIVATIQQASNITRTVL